MKLTFACLVFAVCASSLVSARRITNAESSTESAPTSSARPKQPRFRFIRKMVKLPVDVYDLMVAEPVNALVQNFASIGAMVFAGIAENGVRGKRSVEDQYPGESHPVEIESETESDTESDTDELDSQYNNTTTTQQKKKRIARRLLEGVGRATNGLLKSILHYIQQIRKFAYLWLILNHVQFHCRSFMCSSNLVANCTHIL